MQIRVNISLNEDLVSRIDNYAKTMSLSRSGAISVLVSTQLQQQDSLQTLNEVVKLDLK